MDHFAWQHIEFENGSNPYICKTAEAMGLMRQKYDLVPLRDNFWLAKTPQHEWFGVVRWCEEDIEAALIDDGIYPSRERIAAVRNQLEHHSFQDRMIEAGWDVIHYVIANAPWETKG